MTSERKVVVITGASRGVNTIPGMPCIHHDQYDIDGIRVERFTTAPKDAAQRPPLICVHGGCHASWSWQEHAPVYAAAGYEVHALNWRGRGGSAAINDDSFVKKSIADVVHDIHKVARSFDPPPGLTPPSPGTFCWVHAQAVIDRAANMQLDLRRFAERGEHGQVDHAARLLVEPWTAPCIAPAPFSRYVLKRHHEFVRALEGVVDIFCAEHFAAQFEA